MQAHQKLGQQVQISFTELNRRIKRNQKRCRRGLAYADPYEVVQDDVGEQRPPAKVSKLVMNWIRFEYFYSWVDRGYFQKDELAELFSGLNIPQGTLLTRKEWCLLREGIASRRGQKVISRRRRFSNYFLFQECERLRCFREIFREVLAKLANKSTELDDNREDAYLVSEKLPLYPQDLVDEVLNVIRTHQIAPLQVGQRVLAVHPQTKELKTGTILTSDVVQFHIQFDRTELGVLLVKDIDLQPIASIKGKGGALGMDTRGEGSKVLLNNLRNLYLQNKFGQEAGEGGRLLFSEDRYIPFGQTYLSDANKLAMAILIVLFERKQRLISELKALNDAFEKTQSYNEDYKQKYAWIGIQLQATNATIEPVLTRFRFRSINNEYVTQASTNANRAITAAVREEDEDPEGRLAKYSEGEEGEQWGLAGSMKEIPLANTDICVYKDFESFGMQVKRELRRSGEGGRSKARQISESFFRMLMMFKNFYRVLLPNEEEEDREEEKSAEDNFPDKKDRVLSGCYNLNLEYLHEQLSGIKNNISSENKQLYDKLEAQLLKLCSKSKLISNKKI